MNLRIAHIALIGLGLGATPHLAYGQNALGAGNALDSNPGVGTGGANIPTAVPNFRERNLVVTGDVIGGRGFRGTVGYTAPMDFRGALGSNETFAFRADSAISSPMLFQMGTTYERLRFGQDIGLIEYRRAGSGALPSIYAQDPMVLSDPRLQSTVDRRLLLTSSPMTQQMLVEPRIAGTMQTQERGSVLLSTSMLRGLTAEWPGQSATLAGVNTMDMLRLRQDLMLNGVAPLVGQQFETNFTGLEREDDLVRDQRLIQQRDRRITPPPAPGQPSSRLDPGMQPDYREILQRVAERYARTNNVEVTASPELMGQLDQSYQHLRQQLAGGTRVVDPYGRVLRDDDDADASTRTPIEPEPRMGTPSSLTPRPDELQLPPLEPMAPPSMPSAVPPTVDFGDILRHGQHVQQLAGPTTDRFNELLAEAEAKLREGDYFLAERRFDRALRLTPGHPLAMAGMAHAQLGAGLYLSSSLTLRTLFGMQPEMIDATYAPHLLPRPERTSAAVAGITARMENSEPMDRASYAFLLAYIGRQTGDRALLQQGLDAMAAADPHNRTLALVRQVWLPKAPDDAETSPQE